MVSFDVESLFTNKPLDGWINLAVKYISEGNPGLKLSTAELRNLFRFATAQIHTSYSKVPAFYDQADGVAIVSPLVLILANLFMGHIETTWLELETTRFQNVCSMDDMSMTNFVFWRLNMMQIYYLIISTLEILICFTMEKDEDHKLSYFNVLLYSGDNHLKNTVFRKKTFTDPLIRLYQFYHLMLQNWSYSSITWQNL